MLEQSLSFDSNQEVKLHIIEATSRLLIKNGYYGTSINALSEACHIPPSTLYLYFKGGKDELIMCALAKAQQAFHDELFTDVYQNHNESSPQENIMNMANKLIPFFASQKDASLITLVTPQLINLQNSIFKKYLIDFFNNWHVAFSLFFKPFVNDHKAENYAYEYMSLINWGIIMSHLYQDKKFLEQACHDLNKFCTRIVKASMISKKKNNTE